MADLDYAGYRSRILAESGYLHRFKRVFPTWWSVIADTIAITGLILTPILWRKSQVEIIIPMTLLSAIAVAGLAAATMMHLQAERARRYPNALRAFHTSIHILRDAMTCGERLAPAELKKCLQEVLGAFALGFSIITNAPCRACIKVIDYRPPANEAVRHEDRIKYSYARTFCRDFETAAQIDHLPEGPTDAPVQHNTAFSFLFEAADRRYFIGNDLPALSKQGRYLNSSIQKYGRNEGSWSLPYRSTMVWPIRRITETPVSGGAVFTGRQQIIGYLAVDNPEIKVFVERFDFEIGALLADALYMFLDRAPGLFSVTGDSKLEAR